MTPDDTLIEDSNTIDAAFIPEEEIAPPLLLSPGAVEQGSTLPFFSEFFPDEQTQNQWLMGMTSKLAELWFDNDQILFVAATPENIDKARELFVNIPLRYIDPTLTQEIATALSQIQFQPVEGVPTMQIVTLKERTSITETIYLKHWAESEGGLMPYLQGKNIPFWPNMSELRMAYLISEVMPEFQKSKSRILRLGELPSNLR